MRLLTSKARQEGLVLGALKWQGWLSSTLTSRSLSGAGRFDSRFVQPEPVALVSGWMFLWVFIDVCVCGSGWEAVPVWACVYDTCVCVHEGHAGRVQHERERQRFLSLCWACGGGLMWVMGACVVTSESLRAMCVLQAFSGCCCGFMESYEIWDWVLKLTETWLGY